MHAKQVTQSLRKIFAGKSTVKPSDLLELADAIDAHTPAPGSIRELCIRRFRELDYNALSLSRAITARVGDEVVLDDTIRKFIEDGANIRIDKLEYILTELGIEVYCG